MRWDVVEVWQLPWWHQVTLIKVSLATYGLPIDIHMADVQWHIFSKSPVAFWVLSADWSSFMVNKIYIPKLVNRQSSLSPTLCTWAQLLSASPLTSTCYNKLNGLTCKPYRHPIGASSTLEALSKGSYMVSNQESFHSHLTTMNQMWKIFTFFAAVYCICQCPSDY